MVVEVPVGARLILATHNVGKLKELRAIIQESAAGGALDPETIISAAELDLPAPLESGRTFAENALIKARALATATGLPAVADDSGLSVEIMGGAPGIFSARWAGRHGDDDANLNLLLAQLSEVTNLSDRRAEFVCAAALVAPDGEETVETGTMPGVLTAAPRGENGFGYDPIFIADDAIPVEFALFDPENPDAAAIPASRTNAELTAEEKNAISHRAKAFRALLPAIQRALQTDTLPQTEAEPPLEPFLRNRGPRRTGR